MTIIVLSLGGSIFYPNKLDSNYLRKFAKIIQKLAKKGFKFVIVTGGGKPARIAIGKVKSKSKKAKDWEGIHATRENAKTVAKYVKGVFAEKFNDIPKLIKKNKVVIAGGFKPGMTSDGDAAEIARLLKDKILFNLTNVDGLYDKDPNKYKTASIIPKISSKDFLKIMKKIGYKAGEHFILDLTAAIIAHKSKMKVYILNGRKLQNFENCILNKSFKGTLISS